MVVKKQQRTVWPYGKHLISVVIVSAVLLAVLSVYQFLTRQSGDISLLNGMVIKMVILVPVILIWLLAARGARRFKDYAVTIKNSEDGKSYNYLADGLLVLVAYIILVNFTGTIVLLTSATSAAGFVTILTNHVPLLTAVAASILIFVGSKRLASTVSGGIWSATQISLIVAPFILLTIVMGVDFYNGAADLKYPNGLPRFELSKGLFLFTYFIPHAIVWLLGVFSALNLAKYANNVSGIIFKSLFTDVYRGVVLVYAAVLASQLTISSPTIARSETTSFALICIVLGTAIAGFSYILRGSKKLQRVEEVI